MNSSADPVAELRLERLAAAAGYPDLWRRMLSEWGDPGGDDRAWLIYSANYLFRTAGVRWVLDPITLNQRLPSAAEVDTAPLADLDAVVLTHHHPDHFYLNLLRQFSLWRIRWIVPSFLVDLLRSLSSSTLHLTVALPNVPIRLGGLTLTPFSGLHWAKDPAYPDGRRGVHSMGYLAEFNGKRWLLPGDTREYRAAGLPAFGGVDGLFAHLWLGKGRALDDHFPLLPDFCKFCMDLQPARVVLTHLLEYGRSPADLWTRRHAGLAAEWFKEHAPALTVETKTIGESVEL